MHDSPLVLTEKIFNPVNPEEPQKHTVNVNG
jgi:hypothetical protein